MIGLDNASTLAQSAADTNGIALTHDLLTAGARLAADLTHHSGQLAFDGAAPFRIEAGQVVDVGLVEHIVAVVREFGSPITAPTSTSAASTATQARPSPAARSPRSTGRWRRCTTPPRSASPKPGTIHGCWAGSTALGNRSSSIRTRHSPPSSK